jgi:predicted transcriptional regulator
MLIEHCSRASVQRSQSDLADPAAHSFPTLKRLEAGFGPRVSDKARKKFRRALEAAGVEFIEENGGGPGEQ